MRRLLLTYCLLFGAFLSLSVFSAPVGGKNYSINGYIADVESGERLIGAAIYDTVSHQGTITNAFGFYTLTLPAGEHVLQITYVGYRSLETKPLLLASDTLLSYSIRSDAQLDEFTVVAHQSLSGPTSTQMSAVEIPVAQIKSIPAIGGEVDVLKAIQLLPGVQSGSEGSAGIYVRGGGPDENLILLDGVPLYNVNHAMGMFSVFNADAVKNVTLYKGNFPARFGSRLSSVIDVRQNDGNTDMWHGNLSVGLISAKMSFEGPIFTHEQNQKRYWGDTCHAATTFNISARRTYYDALIAPIMAAITSREMDGDGKAVGGYYFYDLNAKISHTFSENDRLSASFYMGDDVIYVRYNYHDAVNNGAEESNGKMNMRWGSGNLMAATNYQHRFSPRLFSNAQLSFTRYRYDLTEGMNIESKDDSVHYAFDQSMIYKSFLMDLTARYDMEFVPSPRHTMHYGAEYSYHQFRPSISNIFLAELGTISPVGVDTTYNDGTLHGHEAALYFEDDYKVCSWFNLNMGLRASLYGIDGRVYPSVEPRLGLKAMLYKDLAFKASYSYVSQYIHLLSNSSISSPTDLWVPVTADIPPMRSMQVAAGLSYDILGQVEVSLEGYYKKSKNLIEYKDGASFFGSSTGWQDKVAVGDGWSYGVELLLQRTHGPITGWIGYTWSRSMRQFDRPGMEINFGRPFHAKYDREHDLSITLQYQVSKKFDICGTFVYGTGNRATLATQYYYDGTQSRPVEYISERNNYTMPDYHRLDLACNWHLPTKRSGDPSLSKGGWLTKAEHLVSLSVYNVYCHRNPYMMYVSDGRLYQISIFPIIPTVSYSFKF